MGKRGPKLNMKAEKIAFLANPEWIREKYITKGWTMEMICRYLGCSRSALARRMNQHDIRRRKSNE